MVRDDSPTGLVHSCFGDMAGDSLADKDQVQLTAGVGAVVQESVVPTCFEVCSTNTEFTAASKV